MIIVETNYENFQSYLESLTKKARQQYTYACKHNQDLTYQLVPFVREDIQRFMSLWEHQLIRGEYKTWAFPVEYLEDLACRGKLLVFAATYAQEPFAMQFIQRREGFWDCHPPLYDKGFGSQRYLAKYMWFKLIEYCINTKTGPLNLGGGNDQSWKEMIRTREQYPNPAYKWIYVPERVKRGETKDYQIKELNGEKYLYERS